MTHKVLRQGVDADRFRAAVEAHAAELKAWDAHLTLVRAGKAEHYPPPSTFPEIDNSVRRDQQPDGSVVFTPDYELVDRLPVAAGNHAALAERKAALWQEVLQMEHSAIHALLSPAAWRLAALRVEAATERVVAGKGTADDDALITENNKRRAALRDIQIHHAEMALEIEDLGFDQVNQWAPRPYKGDDR